MNPILGGLFRRWVGMNTGPRWVKFCFGVLLTWPWWFLFGYYGAIVSTATVLYWVFGHTWTDEKKIVRRYGPLGWIWVFFERHVEAFSPYSDFLDGRNAAAEATMGFAYFAIINALALELYVVLHFFLGVSHL